MIVIFAYITMNLAHILDRSIHNDNMIFACTDYTCGSKGQGGNQTDNYYAPNDKNNET
jgi:hypothetical protein